MKIEPHPPATGKSQVEIQIQDAQGQPLDPTSVALEANMSHPGMKPVFAPAKRAGRGRWLADLELTMAGDWVVLVEARLDNGCEVQRAIELPGVEAR